tara:strand:- start:24111 stop:24233 length:123 start_codon:yes stop_codon:yes gene_type:complete
MSHKKYNISEFEDHEPTQDRLHRFKEKLAKELHEKRTNWA